MRYVSKNYLKLVTFVQFCNYDRLSRFPLTNSNSNDFQSSINTNNNMIESDGNCTNTDKH